MTAACGYFLVRLAITYSYPSFLTKTRASPYDYKNWCTLDWGNKATLLIQITSPTVSSTLSEVYKNGVEDVIDFAKNIANCWFIYIN